MGIIMCLTSSVNALRKLKCFHWNECIDRKHTPKYLRLMKLAMKHLELALKMNSHTLERLKRN